MAADLGFDPLKRTKTLAFLAEEEIMEDQKTPMTAEVFEHERERSTKGTVSLGKGKVQGRARKKGAEASVAEEESTRLLQGSNGDGRSVEVSVFDDSVQNHFRTMDTIAKLCGEAEDGEEDMRQIEIQRLSSSVTFLREWRHYLYEPKTIKFASAWKNPKGKDADEVTLPQFSSATVPKEDASSGGSTSPDFRDFIMYVGGPVWALDWCPRVQERTDCDFKCEFIAVSAHPPGSSYHIMGAPLTGRGIIQIWCLLNVHVNEEEVPMKVEKRTQQHKSEEASLNGSALPKRPRGRPRKKQEDESLDGLGTSDQCVETLSIQALPKRPRGRPRKKQEDESLDGLGTSDQCVETLSIQYPDNSSQSIVWNVGVNEEEMSTNVEKRAQQFKDGASSLNTLVIRKRPRGRPSKKLEDKSLDAFGFNDQYAETHSIQYPVTLAQSAGNDNVPGSIEKLPAQENCYERNLYSGKESLHNSELRTQQGTKLESKRNAKSFDDDITLLQFSKSINRGIRKKKQQEESLDAFGSSDQCLETLSMQYPFTSFQLDGNDNFSGNIEHAAQEYYYEKSLDYGKESSNNSEFLPQQRRKLVIKRNAKSSGDDTTLLQFSRSNNRGSYVTTLQRHLCSQADNVTSTKTSTSDILETNPINHYFPNDVALPRVALGLAHNGKVAWDVKWKPSNAHTSKYRLTMGYLAVLLGNGSLEVWEVPLPRIMKVIYSSLPREGNDFLIDPRFVKLEPVFRCSRLKSKAGQSIPMSVDWSSSTSHDYLLVGCHDGTVALWKFSSNSCCKDTSPILRFSADTVPIRGVSFAPNSSDQESANVILTAGHKGLKFWDLRDPFRPLWDLHQVPRMIYSVDWLPQPRCVMLSFDDGTMRLLSLSKAACDLPVTGKPFNGTKQQGLHSYFCSTFAIWSVQVSRLTGMVAYCGADGSANRFQLTTKAVENDHYRNRTPHFLCGSITEEDSTITINTPLPNTPSPVKNPFNKCGNKPVSLREVLAMSDQAKRGNSETVARADEELPNLCYGNDPGIESGSEDSSEGKKKIPKPGSGKKKQSQNDQELFGRNVESAKSQGKEKEEVEREIKYEVLPPKTAALHKVRWNMNKGSERWLCYGGAAGVLRCQEIILSDVDKKLMKKR